ncbi:hypothetical protein, conserved [Trypanosoma brucei gambiense DAL972]|uniref:Uncharacterized protein n=1 Tax=Trypanosoma brucei gambiense (strain MHOM/CI/86/DAL972) TaxID=679716 RepID=D0A414_TRYB9|nr:hypothetical protein, conserved [Trypanosoma brucei gambiense DAL972]CBH16008.1 hypothetical protein, conserved [Trypanosoma brucei gambiense DAL972]|eukprot:XP_011778272.1 hypothetical protein, conserved [Trypanosoma brucei gambiense DAL972]
MPIKGSRKSLTKGPKEVCKNGSPHVGPDSVRRKENPSESLISRLQFILSGAVGGRPDGCADRVGVTGPPKGGGELVRLATILHGCFLITMAGKAQLGVGKIGHCVIATVDERWLEAITRYCGFTVVPRDIIECGAAFPEWLSAFESVVEHGVSNGGTNCAHSTPVVKVKLVRNLVPSVAEAEQFLRERWGGGNSWRHGRVEEVLNSSSTAAVSSNSAGEVLRFNEGAGAAATSVVGSVSDEELLRQLSAELRATLTGERLKGVLAQMRREALGLEAREEELINRRQRQERLLSTYDLARVLLGEKRSACNVAELVEQMVRQNRFGDGKEGIIEQLVCLSKVKESGMTIIRVDEGKGTNESKRKRRAKATSDTASLTSRGVELSASSTLKELEISVLRLDRTLASRAGLHQVLQREQPQ